MLTGFRKSTTKGKKYDALLSDGSIVPFGALGYEQYRDSTGLGLYSDLDHMDKKRRESYRKRHSKIKLKDGRYAYKVRYTPAYFSWHYLW